MLEPRNRSGRHKCRTACETCKRRKERCNGSQPCQRCLDRGVHAQCFFIHRNSQSRPTGVSKPHFGASAHTRRRSSMHFSQNEPNTQTSPPATTTSGGDLESPAHSLSASTPSSSNLEASRLIQDRKGRYMFVGDSANLSFLQTIRRVVSEYLGPCSFVDDPLRNLMVEASPDGQPDWLKATTQEAPPGVSFEEAKSLIQRYLSATNCILDLFDESDLLEQLPAWVSGRKATCPIPSPIYYLILAIGAQTSPEDRDELGVALFTHGRYLTAHSFMEDASISTVQSYALITFYLLGAARRNAAFMYLGIAVHAAYAIGLHCKEVAASFSPKELLRRERLWKVIRSLDLFMSASLGRPPSTTETRDTEDMHSDYSASNDLCAIFEKVLLDVYSRRMISTEAVANIGAHLRRWASHFYRGLATDNIQVHDMLEDDSVPNIGLLHVKEAYYWTIMLLTRPFLIESIMLRENAAATPGPNRLPARRSATESNQTLVRACVDSAIRTVSLLSVLEGSQAKIPKRLPFVVNSLFVAALVLGLAQFGDLHQVLPLERTLATAHRLLVQFAPHDAITQRNASIVGYLREACDTYRDKRAAEQLEEQSVAIGRMFGQIHGTRSQAVTRAQSPTRNPVGGNAAVSFASSSQNEIRDPIPHSSAASPIPNDPTAIPHEPDHSYMFDGNFDFSSLPYPVMSPRTLWFESYNANTPLFSTVSNINYAG